MSTINGADIIFPDVSYMGIVLAYGKGYKLIWVFQEEIWQNGQIIQ